MSYLFDFFKLSFSRLFQYYLPTCSQFPLKYEKMKNFQISQIWHRMIKPFLWYTESSAHSPLQQVPLPFPTTASFAPLPAPTVSPKCARIQPCLLHCKRAPKQQPTHSPPSTYLQDVHVEQERGRPVRLDGGPQPLVLALADAGHGRAHPPHQPLAIVRVRAAHRPAYPVPHRVQLARVELVALLLAQTQLAALHLAARRQPDAQAPLVLQPPIARLVFDLNSQE